MLAVAATAVAVILVTSSSPKKPAAGATKLAGAPFGAALSAVPTNHVTGSGKATIVLNGDVATVIVTTRGLLNHAPHAMHIHAGGLGICPPASAARLHNGHRAISTLDGLRYYGDPVVSLTTSGDTSPRSIVAFARYPTSANIHYRRTITIPHTAATAIREHEATVVVHGVDYDGSGVYDDALGPSDLNSNLTGDSTAPALCGSLTPTASTAAALRSGHPPKVLVYTASLSVSDFPMSAMGPMSPSPFWCGGATVDGIDATATPSVGARKTRIA